MDSTFLKWPFNAVRSPKVYWRICATKFPRSTLLVWSGEPTWKFLPGHNSNHGTFSPSGLKELVLPMVARAFNATKRRLSSPPILTYFAVNRPTLLILNFATDACHYPPKATDESNPMGGRHVELRDPYNLRNKRLKN